MGLCAVVLLVSMAHPFPKPVVSGVGVALTIACGADLVLSRRDAEAHEDVSQDT